MEKQDNLIKKQTDEITQLKNENKILNKNHNDKIKEVEELKKEWFVIVLIMINIATYACIWKAIAKYSALQNPQMIACAQ